MKMKHIIVGLALLAMPFTAQAEVREAGGLWMIRHEPYLSGGAHEKYCGRKASTRILQGMSAV